jgi:hypothetical protein
MRIHLCLPVAALCAACSSYGPTSLPARATVDQATQAMGRPSGEYALPNAGKRLEFSRGPYGRHTFMLDFDGQGRLSASRQVLTEPDFDAVLAGMSEAEVLARIGHPAEKHLIGWQQQTVWAYRYESPFCRWFQVGIGRDGRVADTAYGPDPHCEDNLTDRDL